MNLRASVALALSLPAVACSDPNAVNDTAYDTKVEALADEMERGADDLEARVAKAEAALAADLIRPVCKAAMAQLFGHSPAIMTASGDSSLVRIAYRRPDDGKRFTNECRTEGDKIVWRSIDATPGSGAGPWRTRPDDDTMTFKVVGKRVWFTTLYSDGSVETESQPLI